MKATIHHLTRAATGSAWPAPPCAPWLRPWPGRQDYPNKPVKLVVPYPPGGPTGWARAVAQKLQERLGQPFVVDNRPGAGCQHGSRSRGAQRPRDGYTLVVATTAHAINPALFCQAQLLAAQGFRSRIAAHQRAVGHRGESRLAGQQRG